ncbi:MAG TPA: hypothetical protein V6C88_14410 [Chroococcidiopsis sp.]
MPDLNGSNLIVGDGKTVAIAITAETGTLADAAIRFILARLEPTNAQTHLVTLTRAAGQIVVSDETASSLIAGFVIPGAATAGLEVPRNGCRLQWDLEVTPVGGEPTTVQGAITLKPDTRSPVALDGTVSAAAGLTGALNS